MPSLIINKTEEVSAFFKNKWNWLEYQLSVSYKSQQASKPHMIFYLIFIIFITDLNEMTNLNEMRNPD